MLKLVTAATIFSAATLGAWRLRQKILPGAAPAGRYAVGAVDDHLPIADGSERIVRVFFPIDENKARIFDKEHHGKWLPSEHYAHGYASFMTEKYAGVLGKVFNFILGGTTLPVRECVDLQEARDIFAPKAEQVGTILFSHGLGGMRTTYAHICMTLASHGYFVFAIEHGDGSASMSKLGRGTWMNYVPLKNLLIHHSVEADCDKSEHIVRNSQLQRRVAEMHALYKWSSTASDEWKHRFHGTNCIVMGHSFGAATALSTSQEFPGLFSKAVIMDPWMLPVSPQYVDSAPNPSVPTLCINTETFHWPRNWERLSHYLSSLDTASSYTIRGTSHQNQSDMPLVSASIMKRLKMAGPLDPLVALHVNNYLILRFLGNLPDDADAPAELAAHIEKDAFSSK